MPNRLAERAAAYLLQEFHLNRLLQIARLHNPVQARKYLRLLRRHQNTICKQLQGMPPAVMAYVRNYPLEGFSEEEFRDRLREAIP